MRVRQQQKEKELQQTFQYIRNSFQHRRQGVQFQLDALYGENAACFEVNLSKVQGTVSSLRSLAKDLTEKEGEMYTSDFKKRQQRATKEFKFYSTLNPNDQLMLDSHLKKDFDSIKNVQFETLRRLYEDICGQYYAQCMNGDRNSLETLWKLSEGSPVTYVAKAYMALVLHESEIPTIIPRDIPRAQALMAEYKEYSNFLLALRYTGITYRSKHDHFVIAYASLRGLAYDKNFEIALALFQVSSVQNYAPAQCMLGKIFAGKETVDDVPYEDPPPKPFVPNSKEALKWFHLAAEQGYKDAMYELGVMYDAASNNTESEKWRLKCNDYYKTMHYHGFMLLRRGESFDIAMTLLQNSAKMGYHPSISELIQYNISQGNLTEATKWVKEGTSEGESSSKLLSHLLELCDGEVDESVGKMQK